jgi:hypothetical protein
VRAPGGLEVSLRITAAIVGSLLLALAACVCLAFSVPDPRGVGTALAVALPLPLWVAAMCPGFLARRAWKAAAGYLVGAAVLAFVAWILR